MLAADTVVSSSGTATLEPRELDILVGKETKARQHKGSKCFRIFVDRYRRRWKEANNKHKRAEITKEMYLTINQANVRFLRFSETLKGWVEISSTEARDKITRKCTNQTMYPLMAMASHSSSLIRFYFDRRTPLRRETQQPHQEEERPPKTEFRLHSSLRDFRYFCNFL